MFRFSRQFFILFVIVTVLPVFLMILWNIYSSYNISNIHIKSRIEADTLITKLHFDKYLINKKNQLRGILNNVQEYHPDLNKYKSLLEAEKIWWIDSYNLPAGRQKFYLINNNGHKTIGSMITPEMINGEKAFYQVVSEDKKHKLVSIFVFRLSDSAHKGLFIIQSVSLNRFLFFRPPIITRIFKGTKFKPSNLIYVVTEDKLLKATAHMIKPLPPPKLDINTQLQGTSFTLDDYKGNPVATVEIGKPVETGMPWQTNNPMLRDAFKTIVIVGTFIPLMGIILSLIVGYYLKRSFLNPVEELSNVSKLTKFNNLSARVDTNVTNKDIKETLINFNNMLDALEEKEKLKENFISNLTHDLRTPLIAENKALETLFEEYQDDENIERKELLKSLLKNNQHLLNMVNILLETYQFDSGKLKLNFIPINTDKLLEECIIQLKSLASAKNISLIYLQGANITDITGDFECLKRCFINLIDNAIENIPKESIITISTTRKDNNLLISIKDNGPGIPEKQRELLFDRYYSGKRTERKVGSGLGLYICKKIIEAHGGNIAVASEVGEYSDFIVSLPANKEF